MLYVVHNIYFFIVCSYITCFCALQEEHFRGFVVLLFYRKERFVVVFAIKLLQYSKMSSEQENRVEVEWDSGWLTCVYLFPIYGKEVLIVLRLIRLN